MNKIKSCYIHIPFCKNICSYCDFCKFYYHDTLVNSYLDALLEEIKDRYQNDRLDTIYIGGGTPSALSINQLQKLLEGIKKLKISSQLEYTIECNVTDITKEKLELFQKYGINRLSIGVQSFQSKILSFLERNYTKDMIIEKINLAKQYFSNINIDLIYAIPKETIIELKEDLELFLSLNINHISTYSLMIEKNTKLAIQKIEPISEELDSKMYQIICEALKKHGYQHYEISNFAIPGYESKHNLTYWRNQEYYGFGLSASGYINNIRYTNTKNIHQYLQKNYIYEQEIIDHHSAAIYHAILGLRTLEGISKKQFEKYYQNDFVKYFQVQDLVAKNILLETKTNYYINPKYWYILNEILVKFV